MALEPALGDGEVKTGLVFGWAAAGLQERTDAIMREFINSRIIADVYPALPM
jgi:hypothetical protein